MAYQDYYDWVHEAQDLYGLDYRDAQVLWADAQEETGERPTFEMLYEPEAYDEPEPEEDYEQEEPEVDYAEEEIADREQFGDYDLGSYDQLTDFDFDDAWWEAFFDAYDEVEVTVKYP